MVDSSTGPLGLRGTFDIIFDTRTDCNMCIERVYDRAVRVSATISASGLRDALIDLTNIDDVAVTVTTFVPPLEGFNYTIRFIGDEVGGDVPQLRVTNALVGDDPEVYVTTTQEGSEVTGTVTLEYDDTTVDNTPQVRLKDRSIAMVHRHSCNLLCIRELWGCKPLPHYSPAPQPRRLKQLWKPWTT